MALNNAYLKGVYDNLAARYPYQPEYLQAVMEVLESLEPVVEKEDRKSTRLNSSHPSRSRMPSSA